MKILLAEDDRTVADFIIAGLSQNGHSVDHVRDGREALTYCLYSSCDLAILDRMMPGMDGLSVVRALRAARKDVPVLILTAMADVSQRVEGLAAGADDYLVKPFHFSELMARVMAVSRRRGEVVETTSLTVHDLTLDLLARTARRQGQTIDVQAKEFALLEVLMRNAGRVVTRTMLLEQVWNFNFEPNTTVVETHVSRLRAKIDKPFDTPLIHTVRSTGYTMHGPR
ncbi:MAG: response regulator transcription factor [Rhodobacteraceae bacterium]|jgi:two-component system OmpR family response regulator|nr:response regulator transcription factor [Paracoccaceae bacterium]